MEGKRKRGSDADGSISSRDNNDSGAHSRISDEQGDNDEISHKQVKSASRSYYSTHVASVCEAINDSNRTDAALSPFEQLMLQKRREANRLNARRRRGRRKEQINNLQEEQRRLTLESKQLTTENAGLKAELQKEVALASSTASSSVIGHHGTHVQHQRHQQVFRAAPQNDPSMLLRLLLQQSHHSPRQFIPTSTVEFVNSSVASMSQLMQPSPTLHDGLALLFEMMGRNRNDAARYEASGSAAFQQRAPPSLDSLIQFLPLLQGQQATEASVPSTHHAPWLPPQPYAATNSSERAGSLPACPTVQSASINNRQAREAPLDMQATLKSEHYESMFPKEHEPDSNK